MANYNCVIRTNYFHVKDEEAFRALMSRVYGAEDDVELWEEKDAHGNTVFGFGCYGAISGVRNAACDEDDDADDTAYDEFIEGLKQCVADDDAIIIFESGREKLRVVTGYAHIITANDDSFVNLENAAMSAARNALNNPTWTSKCSY